MIFAGWQMGVLFRIWNTKIDRLGLGKDVHFHFADRPPYPCVTLQELLYKRVSQQAVLLAREDDTHTPLYKVPVYYTFS